MSNQVAMTFESAITFDKAFVEDRLNECLSLLKFQLQRCLDGLSVNADLCEKASESFFNFIRHAEVSNGFTDAERTELMFRFFGLKGAIEDLQNADQPTVRQADDSAAQPVAPSQLSMFSLFCKKAKFFSLSTQNEYPGWDHYYKASFHPFARPTLTVTKRILSHTRPVGGLA